VTEHEPGCPLYDAPWLDAAGAPGEFVDRAAAGALTDALAGLSELDVLADARLAAALRRAAPSPDDRRLTWCICRRADGRD
jgi:hypothetical protein